MTDTDYNSSYTGTQIDNAVGAGLNVRNANGLIKSNGLGSVSAATPGADYQMPFIDTVSGAMVTFYQSEAGVPVRSLSIAIKPAQSGTGTPSPTNVRTISGWTGVTINQSGTDTSDPEETVISWQSLASTVYVGTLNVTTGQLIVTHAYTTLSSLSWSKNSSYALFQANLSDAKQYDSGSTPDMYCSAYTIGNSGSNANMYSNNPDKSITLRSNASVLIVKDSTYSDASSFSSAMGSVQIVYELASPQTYSLTATEITSLIGENNIWADAGDVTVDPDDEVKVYIDKVILGAIEGSY